jgi:hypothetical protein
VVHAVTCVGHVRIGVLRDQLRVVIQQDITLTDCTPI